MSHEVLRHLPFPFHEDQFPAALGAVVQTTVLTGAEPARMVVHSDDGSWLVGDGINDPNVRGAVVVAGLRHLADVDPSLAELATMPPGHVAERDSQGDPWRVGLHGWPADEGI